MNRPILLALRRGWAGRLLWHTHAHSAGAQRADSLRIRRFELLLLLHGMSLRERRRSSPRQGCTCSILGARALPVASVALDPLQPKPVHFGPQGNEPRTEPAHRATGAWCPGTLRIRRHATRNSYLWCSYALRNWPYESFTRLYFEFFCRARPDIVESPGEARSRRLLFNGMHRGRSQPTQPQVQGALPAC